MSRVRLGTASTGRSTSLGLGIAAVLLFEPLLGGSSAFADAKLRCDFDADGRTDLAIGVPGDNNGRGAVNVQYSPGNLLDSGAYFRRGLNLPGVALAGQRVGSSLACGDFDGDGFADLAIGVPGESLETGAIVVVYGSGTGLSNKFNTYLTQDTIGLGVVAPADPGDRFGETLAAGDFNGDGRDDLAIGSPGEDAVTVNAAGMPLENIEEVGWLHVLFGMSSGLAGPAQSFSPLTAGHCCVIPERAHYGASLVVGDFDNDGREDLAIGAPLSYVTVDDEDMLFAGSVHILRGKTGVGLTTEGQQYLTEHSFSRTHEPRPFEFFGLSLAAGQFDGLRGDDLAIGSPYEKFDNDFADDYVGYGAVYVAYFTAADLSVFSTSSFDDQSPNGDGLGSQDHYGWALVAGNFDGQNDDDLVIGIPGNVPRSNQTGGTSGSAVVIFSDGTRLSTDGAQFFYPGDFKSGVQTPPPPEKGVIRFAAALSAGDYQGDGVADLFIGVPALTFAHQNAGGVEIRPGVSGVGFDISYMLLTQDTSQPGQTWKASNSSSNFDTEIFINYSSLFVFNGEQMGYAIAR